MLLLFYLSCKKESNIQNYPLGSNEQINTWVLDSLKRYYYWNETLPVAPNRSLAPIDFLNSVRNKADRFSYLFLPNANNPQLASNRNFGFDYATFIDQQSQQIIGVVKFVTPESPAARVGLRRGDYFSRINGQLLNTENVAFLQQQILNNDGFSLTLSNFNGKIWEDTSIKSITKGVILDQQAIVKLISSGDKKVGYLYFNDFNPGAANALSKYFSQFKAAGISDLILDLRYNTGGQVAEAAGICSMVAPNISFNTPFITYKGNKNGGTRTESFGTAVNFDKTANFNSLQAYNLKLNRVYILATGVTASAAEVVINNLKPYLDVVLIGENTRGKDEASFKIFDERQPKQISWELHPIIYKLFNAAGAGNYSLGITPDKVVKEMDNLPLLPIGDENDPLIKTALGKISGTIAINPTTQKLNQKVPKCALLLSDSRINDTFNSSVITHR